MTLTGPFFAFTCDLCGREQRQEEAVMPPAPDGWREVRVAPPGGAASKVEPVVRHICPACRAVLATAETDAARAAWAASASTTHLWKMAAR